MKVWKTDPSTVFYWNSVHLLLQNIIINWNIFWELNWEKKHIIWKVFLHTIWRFEKQSCWGLQRFSNLIQVYWNSVYQLLQNIIINRNIFENSTGKRNISFERSSYILFEGFKSNLVEVFNSFQIWSKSIEILCYYYCRTL